VTFVVTEVFGSAAERVDASFDMVSLSCRNESEWTVREKIRAKEVSFAIEKLGSPDLHPGRR